MDPVKSWALVILGIAAAWYYYTQIKGPLSRKGRGRTAIEHSRRDAAKIKQKKDDRQSGSESPYTSASGVQGQSGLKEKLKKRKPTKLVEELAASSAVDTTPVDQSGYANDDGIDNREFAKRLVDLKKGTLLTAPSKKTTGSGGRTIKAREAKASDGIDAYDGFSPSSSTTGADGDDDLSPAVSPSLKALQKTNSIVRGDISDMLEPSAPGPSVLRITEPTEPMRQQTRRAAPVELQESKKQRQNRKKVEEKKAARQEAEKERRVLLEKQLRTAREAEGRPAKNGLIPAKAPSSSAWTISPKPSNGEPKSEVPTLAYDEPLLDTFDRNGLEASKPSQPAKTWDRELPSEEEQMRMLAETDDSSWSTVNKKSKKKTVSVGSATTSNEGGEGTQPQAASTNPFSQAQDSDWVA